MVRGKSIQIYLPDGNPKGIKICENPSSIVKAILIPRNMIKEAIEYENLEKVGVYFLFSEKDELSRFQTYIGEAEEIKRRIKQHDSPDKDYWNYMVCFISSKDNLNKAHIKFLESYCYEEAKEAGRTELKNSFSPTRSTLSRQDEDFSLTFFDEIKLILGTLGYPIFDKIKKAENEEDIFYCISKDAEARGSLTEEGFVVYAGSKINLETIPGLSLGYGALKESMIVNGILKREGDVLIFTENSSFNSPSGAAAVVLGRAANGWTSWKNKDGKTLDEVKGRDVGRGNLL